MSLDKDLLAADIYAVFKKGENSELTDIYHSARELVDSIYSYISLAEITITTPGLHSSSGATDPSFAANGKDLVIIDYSGDDNVRVALEASFVASYLDPGDENMGQIGFKIFCKGATDDDELALWNNAVDYIVDNDTRELDIDAEDIKSDYESGYSFFISTLKNWSDANYNSPEAVTIMTDAGGANMFLDMSLKMKENQTLGSSTVDSADDIASVIHDATTSATVTSIFVSISGYVQPKSETATIK